jgi:hypothetical protein
MRLVDEMRAEGVRMAARGALYGWTGERELRWLAERAAHRLHEASVAREELERAERAAREAAIL